MPIDLTTRKAHDLASPQLAPLLTSLQGNILKGHGRDLVMNLFLRFTGPPDKVRPALKTLLSVVTSAKEQQEQRERFQKTKVSELFGAFLLTASGYERLGFTAAQLQKLFETGAANPCFRNGMKASQADLGDPKFASWDATFHDRIDALLLLAHDDAKKLDAAITTAKQQLAGIAAIVGAEPGEVLRNAEEQGIEHFGYVDGLSQPVFFKDELKEQSSKHWDPVEPLGLVLLPDPAVNDADAFGSYYVFRKLAQDVNGFRQREADLAKALSLQGADAERAGAMAVGRFRDGTPLALKKKAGFEPQKGLNDFAFKGVHAERCPFHAHIRKTNPRGDVSTRFGVSDDEERKRRIARRGVPYPSPEQSKANGTQPGTSVGLLFACFQASIADQFVFMQSQWVNKTTFVAPGSGQDPLIANERPGADISQSWPKSWGESGAVAFHFGHFVRMLGGEFFFAPSMPFLATLAPPGV